MQFLERRLELRWFDGMVDFNEESLGMVPAPTHLIELR